MPAFARLGRPESGSRRADEPAGDSVRVRNETSIAARIRRSIRNVDKTEAIAEFRADVSTERFIDAWLDPVKVRLWMAEALREMGLEGEMRVVEIDAKVGGRFLISDVRNGVETRHWGEYRQIRRPNRIEFKWITDPADEADPSVVRMSMVDEGAGCVIRIVHEIDLKWSEFAPQIASSWERMIRKAAEVA